MIIVAETREENEIVAKLAKEYSCRGYAREDAFGFTVWSVDDLKSKHPEFSDADALHFLENYEKRLRENCISGGWDFFDYADYSEYPSLKNRVINYIVDTSCKNTATGEWSIYAEDVCKALDISEADYWGVLDSVVLELGQREEIIDFDYVAAGNFDLLLDTDYCKKFEGRIFEYSNGELKKKASLTDKIEDAAGRVEPGQIAKDNGKER